MNDIKVSVITVSYNEVRSIRETVESIINQNYSNFELIIVDGGSTDGTLDIIHEYIDKIDILISEVDNGVYDAMNKGIKLASGDWLVFINAGDSFYDFSVLSRLSPLFNDADLIYSDVLFSNGKIFKCDISKERIVHQSLIYKKKLHDEFGRYLVSKYITTADFMFFMLCKDKKWIKASFVISKFSLGGTSSNFSHYAQKLAIQMLFGSKSPFTVFWDHLIHRIYAYIRRLMF